LNPNLPIYNRKTESQIQKKLADDYERMITCYHEAGHALAGLLCYFKITDVTITRDKKIHGETIYHSMNTIYQITDPALLSYLIRGEIYISYAGLASEKIFYKKSSGSAKFPMVLKDGSSLDIAGASEIITKYNLSPAGKKRYSFKKKMFNETTKYLECHWQSVVLLAHALFKNKTLSFYDLKYILTKRSEHKIFWTRQFKVITKLYRKENLTENLIKSYLKM